MEKCREESIVDGNCLQGQIGLCLGCSRVIIPMFSRCKVKADKGSGEFSSAFCLCLSDREKQGLPYTLRRIIRHEGILVCPGGFPFRVRARVINDQGRGGLEQGQFVLLGDSAAEFQFGQMKTALEHPALKGGEITVKVNGLKVLGISEAIDPCIHHARGNADMNEVFAVAERTAHELENGVIHGVFRVGFCGRVGVEYGLIFIEQNTVPNREKRIVVRDVNRGEAMAVQGTVSDALEVGR